MVSSGFICGFFRVHLGFHVGFLIRISLGFLWVSPRYKQNRIKYKKLKTKRQ